MEFNYAFLTDFFLRDVPYHAQYLRYRDENEKLICMYNPVQGTISPERFKQHLSGEIILACYHADINNSSKWICFDVDNKIDLAAAEADKNSITENLLKLGLTPTVFFSGCKGFHIYVFLDEKVSCETLFNFIESVSLKTLKSNIDKYPSSPFVTWTEGKASGRHLKLPLAIHHTSKKRAEQLTDIVINDHKLIEAAENTVVEKAESATKHKSFNQIINLLRDFYIDGQRHDLVLYATGLLRKSGYSEKDVVIIVEELLQDGGDRHDLLMAVKTTFALDLSKVGGSSKLKEILGSRYEDLEKLLKPSFVALTNSILDKRHKKGLSFAKVLWVSDKIFEFMSTSGRVVKANDSYHFITNGKIFSFENDSFLHFLHLCGLNSKENFGQQVASSLEHKMMDTATASTISTVSQYTPESLLVQLNDVQIVKIERDGRTVVDNGFDNNFFRTGKKNCTHEPESNYDLDNLLFSGLAISEEDKNLVLLWLYACFFQNYLTTKPILLLSGVPGSAKSALSKILLRLVDGLNSSVVAPGTTIADIKAIIGSNNIVMFDNVESGYGGAIADVINAVTTGATFSMRKLYSNNQMISIKPNCMIGINSAFNDFTDDLAMVERIIKISLGKVKNYRNESEFNAVFERDYNKIFNTIINNVEKIFLEMVNNQKEFFYKLRMGEFLHIAACCVSAGIIKNLDYEAILEYRQQKSTITNTTIALVLEILSRETAPISMLSLYSKVVSTAKFRSYSSVPHSYSELMALVAASAKATNITIDRTFVSLST